MSEEFDQEESQRMAFFTGLVAGVMIGAGFGILFAPRRGAETRQQVASSATNVGQKVSKTVDDFTEQSRAAYDRVRDVASRASDFVDRVASNAAKTAESTANFAGEMAAAGSGRVNP